MKASDTQIGGSHYTEMELQPWDVMAAVLSPEEYQGYLKGNIIKYGMRQGRKSGSDDGAKAKHYIERLKELEHVARNAAHP